jgi:hypothetical protein
VNDRVLIYRVIGTLALCAVGLVTALIALNDSEFGSPTALSHVGWLIAPEVLSFVADILILLGAGAVLRLRLQQLQLAPAGTPAVAPAVTSGGGGKNRLRKLAIASVAVALALAGAWVAASIAVFMSGPSGGSAWFGIYLFSHTALSTGRTIALLIAAEAAFRMLRDKPIARAPETDAPAFS